MVGITAVMDYCKNHFIRGMTSGTYSFAASTKKISGTFTAADYPVGSYIYVQGSIQNDGAYKITAVSTTELTVDGTLYDESATVYLYKLRVPRPFVDLVTDIETWATAHGAGQQGVESERIDDYSVSFGEGVKNGGGWQAAFKGRLSQFKAVFNDLPEAPYDKFSTVRAWP